MPVPFNRYVSKDISQRVLQFSALVNATPFPASLGCEVVELLRGRVVLRMAYAPHLIGDPDTGVVHGGAITAALDQASGITVGSLLNAAFSIATLDLRIDHMKPAVPHTDIFIEAECLKMTQDIAFTRGVAYQTSRDEPIALSTGAFILAAGMAAGGG